MTSKEIIERLIQLKTNGVIMDYLIESDFAVKTDKIYVKTRLTIFSPSGKPQVTTGIAQRDSAFGDIKTLQDQTIESAWAQNPIIQY